MQELEGRCLVFAKKVRDLCKELKRDAVDLVYVKQVVRSSSSIGANYIEANEKLGPNDLLMHLRISRKEAKETAYWLELLSSPARPEIQPLLQEVNELRLIFSAIIQKISSRPSSQPHLTN